MKNVFEQDHQTLQTQNRTWWESNPMLYDWERTLQAEPGTVDFYAAVDERLFRSWAYFGHPDYPDERPFARHIDYAALQGKPVLEIGCGAGGVTAVMGQAGLNVSAIDLTRTAINFTQRRLQIAGLHVDLLHADAEQLPYRDDTFDLIWSWGVIHHSADMQRIIDGMYRILRPGGEVKIMVYHRHSLQNWIIGGLEQGILRGKLLTTSYDEILRQFWDGYLARHLTRRELSRMFARFRKVETQLTDYTHLSFLPRSLHMLDRHVVSRVVPAGLKQRLGAQLRQRWGHFLYLEAVK